MSDSATAPTAAAATTAAAAPAGDGSAAAATATSLMPPGEFNPQLVVKHIREQVRGLKALRQFQHDMALSHSRALAPLLQLLDLSHAEASLAGVEERCAAPLTAVIVERCFSSVDRVI